MNKIFWILSTVHLTEFGAWIPISLEFVRSSYTLWCLIYVFTYTCISHLCIDIQIPNKFIWYELYLWFFSFSVIKLAFQLVVRVWHRIWGCPIVITVCPYVQLLFGQFLGDAQVSMKCVIKIYIEGNGAQMIEKICKCRKAMHKQISNLFGGKVWR